MWPANWGLASGVWLGLEDRPQRQECTIDCNGEIFADMFVGAIYGQWERDRLGLLTDAARLKSNYMTTNMSTWIGVVSP